MNAEGEKEMKIGKIIVTAFGLGFTAIILLNHLTISAQTGGGFEIKPSVISAGGGMSSGGSFSVVSTIGEPLAGTNSLGGNFSLLAGFWASMNIVQSVHKSPFDFDGDNKTDVSIFRPAVGEWWYQRSSNGQIPAAQFGQSTDKITPGDFTGDGKTDLVFWRPSTGFWFILRSEDYSFFSFPFGTTGDVPAPADYDNDGRTDAAVFRPSNSTWYISQSGGGGTIISQFGANGDLPVTADYDGDGKSDVAIFRPNAANGAEWWIARSSAGITAVQFGASTDKPVQGDYTGDGKADVAFFRPSTGVWYILRSENFSFFSFPFGAAGDLPVAGDYDGDGKFDAAVFRPSNATWYIQRTTAGTAIQQFGLSTDKPVPNAFVP